VGAFVTVVVGTTGTVVAGTGDAAVVTGTGVVTRVVIGTVTGTGVCSGGDAISTGDASPPVRTHAEPIAMMRMPKNNAAVEPFIDRVVCDVL